MGAEGAESLLRVGEGGEETREMLEGGGEGCDGLGFHWGLWVCVSWCCFGDKEKHAILILTVLNSRKYETGWGSRRSIVVLDLAVGLHLYLPMFEVMGC